MKELFELNNCYNEIAERLTDLHKAVFDIPALDKQSQELSKETLDPTFWSDPSHAKTVNQQLADISDKVNSVNSFHKRLDSIKESLDYLKEDNDPDIFKDADESLEALKADFLVFQKKIFYAGPYDDHNAILEFHPGAGGTEAHDWASMLLRMYEHYAEKMGYSYKVLDILPGEEAGISSATLMIKGKMAYGNLRSESGVHRLVRISPFDASGSRHTSFASVNVMPEFDDSITVNINPADLRIDTYHSSGAGGQNVNKTESAVRITHLPTNIVVSCQIERDQLANKETCMEMLKSKLFQIEERKRQDELNKIGGVKKDISFSSQIRSYVFCPYTLVKDHRSDYSEVSVQSVMDGNLSGFTDAYLKWDFIRTHIKPN
ncbi:MAG: peptide chain release factor 2 [Bacilli bacterium]